MSMNEERSTDSVQSVEIPSDMYNLLQNGQAVTVVGDSEYDNQDLMHLTVMRGLQDQDNKPHLKILEQPRQRGFRFRYGCEGPSHGGLPGTNSQRGKRSFPSVEICNYKGPARIVVSLVTNEDTPRPHAHSLVGKHCKDGLCTVQVGPKDMTASFPNLGILHVTRKDVVPTLKSRILAQHRLYNHLISDSQIQAGWTEPSDEEVEKKAKEMAKDMDLSVVRLCFQTYLPDSTGHFTQPLEPVISVPVFDSKAPNATTLKICRMDKSAGCCTGGEEVYLLCDKVQKEDIQVRFFELSADGQITWQKFAEFGPTDVHRQYAIVFKTPSYHDINIDRPVYVHVQLKRKSDNETSDPKPFTYHPQVPDREGILRKRKKHLAHFNEYSSPYQGSVGGGGGIGGGSAGGSFPFQNFSGGNFGSNFSGGSQFAGGATQNQQASQQSTVQSKPVAAISTNSQQLTFTTNTTPSHQALPSIATLTQRQPVQQQAYQLTQQHLQHQTQQQQQPQPQPQQPQQQQQMQPQQQIQQQMHFQFPAGTGMNFQGQNIGGATGYQIKVENDTQQVCMDSSSGFQLDPDVRRDCAVADSTVDISDLIPKGVSKVQRSTGKEEKNIQTDEVPIDHDSMAWRVAQVTANALHDYAATGDIKTILTVQRHLIAVEDDNGDTPLHAAVINKKYDVLHSLLSAVIKIPNQRIVNQVNHLKQTPLHLAVLTKQSKMVEVLMRCGADPNVCDSEGNTPLHLAVKKGLTDGVGFLVCGPKAKAAVTPTKAEINPRNFDGLAPIHLAVLEKSLESVKLLISQGADINLADGKTGRAPLHYAVEVEDFPILGHLLIEAKVDIQAVTYSGDTALHLASSLDLRAIAALLVAAGVDPKQENCDVESDDEDDDDGVEDDYVVKEVENGEEERKMERRGKTALQLARSDKMREILSGRSSLLPRSCDRKELEYLDTRSTISSAGSLCGESIKEAAFDGGYFSEKSSSMVKERYIASRQKGYGLLKPSLITEKGNIELLPQTTRTQLAAMLDDHYPMTNSWFTLAHRLGLSNMAPFLKQVPSPTEVILNQFQAMDGTIEELRDVLLSMEHRRAVAILDEMPVLKAKDDDSIIVCQSLRDMSISSRNQPHQQIVY